MNSSSEQFIVIEGGPDDFVAFAEKDATRLRHHTLEALRHLCDERNRISRETHTTFDHWTLSRVVAEILDTWAGEYDFKPIELIDLTDTDLERETD